MKTLLKLTVVSLSVFACVQAEASSFYTPPCRSGDSLQNGVCISGPAMSPVQPVLLPPVQGGPVASPLQPYNLGPVITKMAPAQNIPGGFKCDGGPQVPGCGATTSETLAQLQAEQVLLKNQLARATTSTQKNLLQSQIAELQQRLQVVGS